MIAVGIECDIAARAFCMHNVIGTIAAWDRTDTHTNALDSNIQFEILARRERSAAKAQGCMHAQVRYWVSAEATIECGMIKILLELEFRWNKK